MLADDPLRLSFKYALEKSLGILYFNSRFIGDIVIKKKRFIGDINYSQNLLVDLPKYSHGRKIVTIQVEN